MNTKEYKQEEYFLDTMDKIIAKYTSFEIELSKLNDELDIKEFKNHFYSDLKKFKNIFRSKYRNNDRTFESFLKSYQRHKILEGNLYFMNVITTLSELLIFDAKIYDSIRSNEMTKYREMIVKKFSSNNNQNKNNKKTFHQLFYYPLLEPLKLSFYSLASDIKNNRELVGSVYLNRVLRGWYFIKEAYYSEVQMMKTYLDFIHKRINNDLSPRIISEERYQVIFDIILDNEDDRDIPNNYDLKNIVSGIREYIFQNIDQDMTDIISELQKQLLCCGCIEINSKSIGIDTDLCDEDGIDILITLATYDILEAIVIDIEDQTPDNEIEHALICSILLKHHLDKYVL